MSQPIVLTAGQQAGFEMFANFYMDPNQYVMLLKGHSGTGKSTLVRKCIEELPKLNQMVSLLNPDFKQPEVRLTAPTHQAAEALVTASGGILPTQTIQSALGLVLQRDHMTGKSQLVPRQGAKLPMNELIVVDEASFIDQELLSYHFTQSSNCKFLFMGDHAQLTPVGSSYMPAFQLKGLQTELTEVRRQNFGPLLTACEGLRATVLGGPWPQIIADGTEIMRVDWEEFKRLSKDAFLNPDIWGNSKVIAYTNDRVTAFNAYLSKEILGSSSPQIGQRMIVNEAITCGKATCNTNEEVFLEDVRESERWGIKGWNIKLRGKGWMYFLPLSRSDAKARLKAARAGDEYDVAQQMGTTCIDLRPSFACTVNKSQGSTFETAFIDLSDICKKVRSPNQLARALYVAFSRASRRVVITGDM